MTWGGYIKGEWGKQEQGKVRQAVKGLSHGAKLLPPFECLKILVSLQKSHSVSVLGWNTNLVEV